MKPVLFNADLCQDALKLKKDLEMNFILLGEYLSSIKEHRLYDQQYESFDEFLMEMHMTKGTASKLINIYKMFIVKYQFSPLQLVEAGSWTKLAMVVPLIRSKEDADYWLTQSTILTSTDLTRSLKEEKTGKDMSKCKHEDSYTLCICRDCGYKYETHPHD